MATSPLLTSQMNSSTSLGFLLTWLIISVNFITMEWRHYLEVTKSYKHILWHKNQRTSAELKTVPKNCYMVSMTAYWEAKK